MRRATRKPFKVPKPRPELQFEVTHSCERNWDHEGRGFEKVNNGPMLRRPDLDFGTPNGDLLIDPWIQDALRKT